MEFKRIISPFILLGLFATFSVVCLVVWIRKGKSGRWISHKLKLGAAILTITGISTGCPTPQITCYDPIPQNWFSFDSIDVNDYSVVADLPSDSVLTGKVYEPTYERYQFKVETLDSELVCQGAIESLDGEFNQPNEDFRMAIPATIDAGSYRLRVFSSERDGDEGDNEVYSVGLTIRKEKS